MAALVVWTAFASVFSLLLGYSRVPYAAARDGNYFRFLARSIPGTASRTARSSRLGLVASLFCFLSLAQVITYLVVTRIFCNFCCSTWRDSAAVPRPDLPCGPSKCRSIRCRR